MAKGLGGDTAVEVAEELERLKWFLWHGNVFRALQVIGDLETDLDVDDANPGQRKLRKGRVRRLHPGQHLLDPQLRRALPRWRGDLQCVRGVVGQPGGEQADGQKAEMRWTPKGAHLLLQVRTRVLNDELGDAFRRWYPEVVSAPKAALAA